MSDITRFCAINDPRAWICKPFRFDGRLYATDGRIAVRMPDDAAMDAATVDDGNTLVQLFAKREPLEYLWVAVPQVEGEERCRHCSGTGRANDCPDCDGEGEFTRGRHTYECQECDGSGDRECRKCRGHGVIDDGAGVAHAHYAKRYLRLIAEQFPGAEIGVPKVDTDTAMWRRGDVVGLLMPMRK